MEIKVFKGNIVDACVDAVVLPANIALKEGPGVSGAIFEAAGRKELKDACEKIGHCDVGMATVTPGFRLMSDYIIHAVVPKWIDGEHDEYAFLSSAYLSALATVDVMKCESIAFPLLASGNNGFDLELAFDIAIKSIETYQAECLKEARLVLYGDRAAACAQRKGFGCTEMVVTNHALPEGKSTRAQRTAKILKEGAGVLADFVLDVMESGVEYMKDKEHRKQIIETGFMIAQTIISLRKNDKKS